ncbi:hypothetical protein H4R19_003489 [Coemansia spiralis]|nr:hypothetical protein H4R19_003489 [Coemansia spiralis]
MANEVKRTVNRTFTPRAMDMIENIDCWRTAAVRAQLVQMLRMQEAANYMHRRAAARVGH